MPCFFKVVIFVKSVQRCVALAQLLTEQNFPAIGIHRGMNQEERLSRYQQFKDFQKVSRVQEIIVHISLYFIDFNQLIVLIIVVEDFSGNQFVWKRYGHRKSEHRLQL